MKTNIIYSDNTLFVYLDGNMKKKDLKNLKNKVDSIINEYQINDIVLNTNGLEKNNFTFEFLNEYNDVRIKKM